MTKSKIKTIEFEEIEKFTFSGGYAVDVDFKYLRSLRQKAHDFSRGMNDVFFK